MRAHLLFSQERDEIIMSFDSFDKELIPRETESIDKRLTLDNF